MLAMGKLQSHQGCCFLTGQSPANGCWNSWVSQDWLKLSGSKLVAGERSQPQSGGEPQDMTVADKSGQSLDTAGVEPFDKGRSPLCGRRFHLMQLSIDQTP